MKIVYSFILISVLQPKFFCYENNVCKTIQDYYTIKDNPNCEYDIAADPDTNPINIIEYYGYPAEVHQVTTQDGYILTMFRIPNHHPAIKKGPVFVQHGWLYTSAGFVGLRNNSLAFLLADAGYDVWLGNARGTEYSEGHINLTVHNQEYWNYGIDEMALYDIPAILDYISQATGNKGDIVYIGHSLGGGIGVIYSSTFPEQARRTLRMLILLAPATYMSNVKAPLIRYPNAFFKPLYQIIKRNDLVRLTSQSKIMKSISRLVCFESPLLLERCHRLLNILLNGVHDQIDEKSVPVLLNRGWAGASIKIIPQIADFVRGNFRRYDYGSKNLQIYGSNEPPPFEVSRIQVPVFLVHAVNDWILTPKDMRNFYNDLSPAVQYGRYEIRAPNFNHVDFMYARNAKSIVYNVLLEVLHSIKH